MRGIQGINTSPVLKKMTRKYQYFRYKNDMKNNRVNTDGPATQQNMTDTLEAPCVSLTDPSLIIFPSPTRGSY